MSRRALLAACAVLAAACDAGTGGPAATSTEGGAETGEATAPGASGSASAPASASATASAAGSAAVGPVAVPVTPEVVAKVVNPKGRTPYAGPVGTLRGTVKIEGEPAPSTSFSFPAKCREAAATYGKLFRVGQGGTVADVLVTVTGYDGFVPAKAEAVEVTLRRCAASTRTVAMTFGQRLDVRNVDATESYMPFLDGAPTRAIMVAVPGGEPVKLYPQEPAASHYMLRDQLPKPWLTADVYVLKFPTFDVTELDGSYEIHGIPVGPVRVNAFLPAIGEHVEKRIEIVPGIATLDFVLKHEPGAKDGGGKGAAPRAKKPAE